nr:hypothetical protein Itr_chr11CG13500 [Ipomoea trifida]
MAENEDMAGWRALQTRVTELATMHDDVTWEENWLGLLDEAAKAKARPMFQGCS